MAQVCELSGKKYYNGFSVSHSNIKTKRKFLPNLQKKRLFVPELGKWFTVKVSTSAMKTINKNGIYNYLKETNKLDLVK